MQLNLEKKKLPSEANLRLIANLCIALANKQSALEDKTVAPWKADTTYQKDVSYVSYNGHLWLCTITNTDSEFNEAHWQKLSDNITELSKDDIAALINLTPEQVTALQTLIDDDTITATKTYSSSKIYAAINDAIAECKDDTLKQIGSTGIVPVVVLNKADDAEPLAQALVKGGLPCAEVTFRTDAAEESICRIAI